MRNADYSFSEEMLNFGTVELESKNEFKYWITNKSNEPLLIKLVRSSCACTDIEWTKKPILPNQKGFVKGVFIPKKEGPFFKQMFIHLSSRKVPMNTVSLQGVVEK